MPFRGLTKVVYTVIGECIILYLDIIEDYVFEGTEQIPVCMLG